MAHEIAVIFGSTESLSGGAFAALLQLSASKQNIEGSMELHKGQWTSTGQTGSQQGTYPQVG